MILFFTGTSMNHYFFGDFYISIDKILMIEISNYFKKLKKDTF